MATLSIKDQIVQEVDALASQQQEQLLQYQDFRLPHPPAPSPILGEGEKNAS